MIKRNTRQYLIQSLTLLIVALFCFLGYTITKSLMTSSYKSNENIDYVSYEVLTDNTMPVSKPIDNEEIEKNADTIIRPYTATDITIGKSFYDYKSEKEQKDAIIYYENTYIQNTGVDYVSKNEFSVNSIADGVVEKITEDDILGTTIKIKHNNNLIAVYQSLKDIKVKEKDKVKKGQVIGNSATNSIGEELGNHLHFELYENNNLINPEEFFNKNKVDQND